MRLTRSLASSCGLIVAVASLQASSGSLVPLKGQIQTVADFVPAPEPAPFECPGTTSPFLSPNEPIQWVQVKGTGQVSHLGSTTVDNLECIWIESHPECDGTTCSPVQSKLYGEAEFFAANGDALHFTFDGDVVPMAGDATQIVFNGSLLFDGGTGRFAEAAGSARYSGGYSFANEVWILRFRRWAFGCRSDEEQVTPT